MATFPTSRLEVLKAEKELLQPTLRLPGLEPSPAGSRDFEGTGNRSHLPHPAKPQAKWSHTCEEGLHELAVGHFHDGPPRVGRKCWISTVRQ